MITNFTAASVANQAGRTFFITGANTGLGFEAAKILAARGGRVILGCRNPQKAEAAVCQIKAMHPRADLATVHLDLASLASVRQAADQVLQTEDIDVLINNAGLYTATRHLTVDGFELHMATNHLGHFAFTGLLLPKLLENPTSRIVVTSSLGHRQGKLPFEDMTRSSSYNALQAYADSKLANLWHMFELDFRLRAADLNTISVACHPGVSMTELLRDLQPWQQKLFSFGKPLLNTPAQAAWPTLAAATSPQVGGGDYLGPGGFQELRGSARAVEASELAKHPETAQRMWDISVELTGVEPKI